MKIAQFIGKQMNLSAAEVIAIEMGFDFWYNPPAEQSGEYGHVEIYLSHFDLKGQHMDKTGRNAYSLEIDTEGNRIVSIVRMGHCHMSHSGQGSDDELQRFPHKSLEAEAQEVLERLTGRT